MGIRAEQRESKSASTPQSTNKKKEECPIGSSTATAFGCNGRSLNVVRYRPYALTSPSGHLSGKMVTKQSKRTDLYARRTGLANEQPPFDL